MNHFNKKQKIIIGAITSILVLATLYYVYAQENQNNQEQNLEIQEIEKENEVIENEIKEETIKVHVSGAVHQAGVIELEKDTRIADAIEKAGGTKENACIDEINLAQFLEDGMKIYIPTKEEIKNEEKQETTSSETVKETKTIKTETKVNINTATQTQLETLPGIGPSTAQKILAYRKEKGKFKTIEEIKEVNGIGESKFNKIKDFIHI